MGGESQKMNLRDIEPRKNLRVIISFLACLSVLALISLAAFQQVVSFRGGPPAQPVTLIGYLGTPAGDGPFPAIVLLHGCSGLEDVVWRGLEQYAAALNTAGYVTLIVDSHGPRGISANAAWATTCVTGSQIEPRLHDAFSAAALLAARDDVDPARIGVMGMSEGGIVSLRAAQYGTFYGERGARFAAAVALYPNCASVGPGGFVVPLLILIGSEDNITPAYLCERLVADLVKQDTDSSVMLHVYEGASHSFDLPLQAAHVTSIGTVAPNPGAALDARQRLLDFFDRHLLIVDENVR